MECIDANEARAGVGGAAFAAPTCQHLRHIRDTKAQRDRIGRVKVSH